MIRPTPAQRHFIVAPGIRYDAALSLTQPFHVPRSWFSRP